ncbi:MULTISPECIES: hypothetical protein [unclassified Candidatus Accumulibacter]|nr:MULTISPECIES: hypothetical protein [unclassified Candidatus Accumulibacter]MQM34360.1 hypothetical protein [Candidatus Accumulibacter phosphatis]HRE69112.1 hypothetical protein [Accumulibacter sp.]
MTVEPMRHPDETVIRRCDDPVFANRDTASATNERQGNRMEKWITRSVALLCATGSVALFWTFGVFLAVPWGESRMLSLNSVEWQVLGIPLLIGMAVTWGALHILAIADREAHPRLYFASCVLLVIVSAMAVIGGMAWTADRAAVFAS